MTRDSDRNPEGEDRNGLRAEHESAGRKASPEGGIVTTPDHTPGLDDLIERLEKVRTGLCQQICPHGAEQNWPHDPACQTLSEAVSALNRISSQARPDTRERAQIVEAAAQIAEDESLILSKSRSGGSFGATRADHGKLIGSEIRRRLASLTPSKEGE